MKFFTLVSGCLFFIFATQYTGYCGDLDWKKQLIQHLKEPTPDWMEKQVAMDLSHFKGTFILKKDFKKKIASKNCRPHVLFKICKNRVYMQYNPFLYEIEEPLIHIMKNRANIFKQALIDLQGVVTFEKLLFILCVTEYCEDKDVINKIPTLGFSKKKNFSSILVPDPDCLKGHTNLLSKVLKESRKYPWDKKHNKLIWRGATTGFEKGYPWKKETFFKLQSI